LFIFTNTIILKFGFNFKMIIKKENINFILITILIFVAFFDAHLEKIFQIDRLPLAELLLMPLALFSTIINILNNKKSNHIFILIFTTILLTIISGMINLNKPVVIILGVIWLYKSMLAFYIGTQYKFSLEKYQQLIKWIYRLSVFSAFITILQLVVRINPLGFYLHRSYHVGIMDNPNKNAFIMLFGLLFSQYYKTKYNKIIAILFVFGIVLTQSRQILLLLIVVFLYYFIFIKKYYLYASMFFIATLGFIVKFKDVFFKRLSEIDRIMSGEYFRVKAIKISFQAINDNPFFGLGPGSFGGAIANIFNSPYHDKYMLFEHWKHYKNANIVPGTIDMFWPHMMVEVGVISLIINILIYYIIFKNLKKNKLFFPLMIYIVIFFMSFFSMAFEATYLSIPIFIILGINYNRKTINAN